MTLGGVEKSWPASTNGFQVLDSVRQEALIDLSFNIGQTKLRKFVKALGHMADGNYEEAGQEFYR